MLIVPHVAPEQPAPETVQLTLPLGLDPGADITVALNCPVAPLFTLAGPLTLTDKLPLERVTVVLEDFEPSAWLVAVTVTVAGEGNTAGAA